MKYSLSYTSEITAANIISTADLKTFLRVDHSEEDTLIEALRLAAVQYVENYCNVKCGSVSAVMYLDKFPVQWEVPVGPVTAVGSITYNIGSATTTTLSTDNYFVDLKRKPARISVINVPDVYDHVYNGVQINLTIGYAEASLPEAMIQAIRLLVGHYYEQRQETIAGTIITNIPSGIHSLLNPYRIISDR